MEFQTQTEKALKALSKISKKDPLLDSHEEVLMVVALQELPKKLDTKPKRIIVPHGFYQDSRILVIKKDAKKGKTKTVDEEEELELKNTEIMTISKLKTLKSYEQKRALLQSYDLFCADEAVLPLLPKLLGKAFFLKKKQPVAISVAKLEKEVELVRNSTFVYFNLGTCLTIKVGSFDLSVEQLQENVQAVFNQLLELKQTKDKIQSVYLKTKKSTSLPVYLTIPEHDE